MLLREHFKTKPFTIEEAERYTLTRTRFLDEKHLRQWALIPLQTAGQLQVVSSTRRRDRDFPDGTVMRFVG